MTHLIRHGTGRRARKTKSIKMLQNGGGLAAAADSAVIDTNTEGFLKDVIEVS
jgi:hypothetical protein